MTVKDIFLYLNSLFPVTDAMDFDNVGILVGDSQKTVNKALISLDCTLDTIKLAKDNNCELIITHHPVIFEPLKCILKGSIQYELIHNDLSVISMHTNLDIGEGGVNDTLCKILGLKNIASLPCIDGYTIKSGIIPETNAKCLGETIKAKIGGCVKYVDGGNPISKVIVCGGSGGNYIEEAVNSKFDALITADVKHHQFLMARDNGISLFDAGHFNTEDVVIEPLKTLLDKKFPNLIFLTYHPDIFRYE